jgi:hypothetical protein
MSLAGSSNPSQGPYRKPSTDLYTVLLAVALLALIAGTVFLYMELLDYGSPPYQGAPSAFVVPQGPNPQAGSILCLGDHGHRPSPPVG